MPYEISASSERNYQYKIICLELFFQSTYYVPAFTPRGGRTVAAKGKLYDKYTSLNKELREANLRRKRPAQSEDIEPHNLLPENNEGE